MNESMKYKKGYKYVLVEPEVFFTSIKPEKPIQTDWIRLDIDGRLDLAHGYAWDGSTWAKDTKWCMRASACHDALCQLIQLGLLDREWKRPADLEYYNICRADGMPLVMAVNRLFWIQFHDWDNSRPREVLTIP